MKRRQNVSLWRDLEFQKWILEANLRIGGSPYLARKWFRESYGILNGVRYLGPRRRAEYDALAYGPDSELEDFKDMWKRIIPSLNREEGMSDTRYTAVSSHHRTPEEYREDGYEDLAKKEERE